MLFGVLIDLKDVQTESVSTVCRATYHNVTTQGVIGFRGTSYFRAKPKSAEKGTNTSIVTQIHSFIVRYGSMVSNLGTTSHSGV